MDRPTGSLIVRPFPDGPLPKVEPSLHEHVVLRGHYVIVTQTAGAIFGICQFCGLRANWPYVGRMVGVTDRMVAVDVASRLASMVPEPVQCHEVRDYLVVQEVMEL